ncbi:MFS transporter [Desulfovibrio sp. OttesenSCG-928-G15]|nr:MFS transporter [Desulfovibrio sp. OttesenSCG-928-G15]
MAEQKLISFEEAPFSPIHRKVRAGAFMGMICCGYILGIVGIALSYAAEPLGLTSFWMGVIGAGSLFGILFGSLVIGSLADRMGRRSLFVSSMVVSVALSIVQAFITDPALLAVVRFLLGMSIGWDYTVGISLLSEWTPRKVRPRVLGWLLVLWTIGYVIAYLAGFVLNWIGDVSWQIILCSSAVPGLITLVMRLGTPESPGWLARKGRNEEALAIIHKYLGDEYGLPEEEEQPPSVSWFRLFSKELRYNTLVSGVFFACQVLPFFAISIFLPLVLKALNIDNPHASGILYNVFTMIGVLVGTWLLDVISRRAFLLWTFYGAAAVLVLMTVWQGMPGTIALICLAALSLVLAISIALEFAYPPELFPTELRASGVGLTIAISRIGAAGGTFLLPIVSEQFGVYASLGGCIGALLLGGVVCQLWAPETSEKFMDNDAPTVGGVPVPPVAVRS